MKLPNDILEEHKDKSERKFDVIEIFGRIIVIFSIALVFIVWFKLSFKTTPQKPNINKYELVEFTNAENKKSYTDIITTENNDKYIKFIFVDKNKSINIDKIKNNSFNDIKFIETINKPFVEIETIEKEELFVFNTSEKIYTLYLPKEDIETLKNEW